MKYRISSGAVPGLQAVWNSTSFDRMYQALNTLEKDPHCVSQYIFHKLMGHDIDEILFKVGFPTVVVLTFIQFSCFVLLGATAEAFVCSRASRIESQSNACCEDCAYETIESYSGTSRDRKGSLPHLDHLTIFSEVFAFEMLFEDRNIANCCFFKLVLHFMCCRRLHLLLLFITSCNKLKVKYWCVPHPILL